MNKETSPKEKARREFVQKRILLEDTLIGKLLRELPHKTSIKVGDIVFKVGSPDGFEVIKVEGDQAEVIPYSKLSQKNTTISMLNFKLSELWHEDDYLKIEEMVIQLTDQEISARISGLDLPADSVN